MKIKFVSLLLSLPLTVLADGDSTVYRYGVPHKCNPEVKMCIQSHFLTTEEELKKSNDTVMYLAMDYKNKSRLLELQEKGDKYPMSVYIVNSPEDTKDGIKSMVVYYKVNCQNLTFTSIGLGFHSGFFAGGEQINLGPTKDKWSAPSSPLLKFAVSQLCR